MRSSARAPLEYPVLVDAAVADLGSTGRVVFVGDWNAYATAKAQALAEAEARLDAAFPGEPLSLDAVMRGTWTIDGVLVDPATFRKPKAEGEA